MATDKHDVWQEWLILRCKRGDSQAFARLVGDWEGRLFYYVRRLVKTEGDAWDVLQQTWLKVFTGIKSLDDPRRLPTWLYQIARHTAMSYWRRYYRTQARFEDQADLSEVTTSADDDHFDNVEQVHRGLSRISPAHCEVLTLYFLEDLSLKEMAEVLAIPPGTVKSRLHYAKRALRAVLEEDKGSHES